MPCCPCFGGKKSDKQRALSRPLLAEHVELTEPENPLEIVESGPSPAYGAAMGRTALAIERTLDTEEAKQMKSRRVRIISDKKEQETVPSEAKPTRRMPRFMRGTKAREREREREREEHREHVLLAEQMMQRKTEELLAERKLSEQAGGRLLSVGGPKAGAQLYPYRADSPYCRQSGYHGNLSTKQESALMGLKGKIIAENLNLAISRGPEEHEDAFLLRFLRARKFVVSDAFKMLVRGQGVLYGLMVCTALTVLL
jgi:hypothetical protein